MTLRDDEKLDFYLMLRLKWVLETQQNILENI